MATSIAAGGDTWAVVPMAADPPFWEVFARTGNSGSWKLVTPPGVADNPELRDRIARMRADGMTLQQIADRLNADGVPTVRGGAKWRPSSVQAAAGYRRPPRKGSANGYRTGLRT